MKNTKESTEEEPIVQYVDDSVNESNCGTFICDPRKWFFRYFGLAFMCFLSFGSYFCYDNVIMFNLCFISIYNNIYDT